MNNKIKICFVLPNAYLMFNSANNKTIGGAEINLYNLSISLSSKDIYSIRFFVGDFNQNKIEYFKNIELKKLKYMNTDIFKTTFHKILRHIILFIQLFKDDSDIYITSTATELFGWLTLFAGKIRRKKIIYRIASDMDLDISLLNRKSRKLSLLYMFGLRNCAKIICQSTYQKYRLKEIMNIEGTVIHNGFFINEYEKTIDINKSHILWVSRALELKRPEMFLDLARSNSFLKFIIVIPGQNEIHDKIKELSHDIPNLTFYGYIPFDEIQDYYNRAILFVNTSTVEGFPNSFIQAFIGKTPILSFSVNPDNIIEKYQLGCFCNESFKTANTFIRDLNPSKISEYGNNAFNYVMKNHNIKKIAAQYEKCINTLLNRTEENL